MLFNSYEFPIFFTIVYCLYRLLGDRYRLQNLLLLVAAAVFYGWWDLRFLYLLVLSTALDYSTGLLIGCGSMPWKQRLAVTVWQPSRRWPSWRSAGAPSISAFGRCG